MPREPRQRRTQMWKTERLQSTRRPKPAVLSGGYHRQSGSRLRAQERLEVEAWPSTIHAELTLRMISTHFGRILSTIWASRGSEVSMNKDQRIALLERALVQYIERYGLTDLAREVMRSPAEPKSDPPAVGHRGSGSDAGTWSRITTSPPV